jgi:hypothetical protein
MKFWIRGLSYEQNDSCFQILVTNFFDNEDTFVYKAFSHLVNFQDKKIKINTDVENNLIIFVLLGCCEFFSKVEI